MNVNYPQRFLFVSASDSHNDKLVHGIVHPLVSLFVCAAERSRNNESSTSILLCQTSVLESGKYGALNVGNDSGRILRVKIP